MSFDSIPYFPIWLSVKSWIKLVHATVDRAPIVVADSKQSSRSVEVLGSNGRLGSLPGLSGSCRCDLGCTCYENDLYRPSSAAERSAEDVSCPVAPWFAPAPSGGCVKTGVAHQMRADSRALLLQSIMY